MPSKTNLAYSIREAAILMSRPQKTIYRWIYEKRIERIIRIGGRIYVPEKELIRLRREEK